MPLCFLDLTSRRLSRHISVKRYGDGFQFGGSRNRNGAARIHVPVALSFGNRSDIQGVMWPVLARCVFPLKSMFYDVNDTAEYSTFIE